MTMTFQSPAASSMAGADRCAATWRLRQAGVILPWDHYQVAPQLLLRTSGAKVVRSTWDTRRRCQQVDRQLGRFMVRAGSERRQLAQAR